MNKKGLIALLKSNKGGKMPKRRILKSLICALCAICLCGATGLEVFAANDSEGYGISMSPLNQKIVLNPGEVYSGSFSVTNPGTHTKDFSYKVEIEPFFVDENYNDVFDQKETYNQIVDWTTVTPTEGTISPNETQEIYFTINVPEDVPAGGQYMSITVYSNNSGNSASGNEKVGAAVNETIAMGHLVYAEVAGTARHSGEIVDANVPSFLLSGNISGNSSVKNTGNTHGTATYKLQVFPLFSDEEVYTNEENPETMTIFPNRTFYNVISWDETPDIGIFNVKYTVEFEGETTAVEKMVIKCPVWLIALILIVICAIIVWIVSKTKGHKKTEKKASK